MMNIKSGATVKLALMTFLLINGNAFSDEPAKRDAPFKIFFWNSEEVQNSYGQFQFKAMPANIIGRASGYPKMRYGCSAPRSEGGQWVYGWTCMSEGSNFQKSNSLKVIRCWTKDGINFHDQKVVMTEKEHLWQGFVNLVRRETDNRIFLFPYGYNRDKGSMDFMVYSSGNGTKWKLDTEKAYSDHDACCVIWDSKGKQFINYQSTYQKWKKRYPDNIGGDIRRVISIRYSADGIHWKPDGDYAFRNKEKEKELWVPDEKDPKELEFYRICAFPYHDRYIGILVLYAPSPQIGNTREGTLHGPGLGTQLCYSLDGIHWNRPDRTTDITAESHWAPLQGPLQAGGYLRFYAGIESNEIRGLEETRLFGAYCRANGEFSTKPLTVPEQDLTLNISASDYDSYFMAEVRDLNNQVIPGYEKEKCVHKKTDEKKFKLKWKNRTTSELSGKKVQLRIYVRNATVFGLSE